jgi:prevent-host-death family protein
VDTTFTELRNNAKAFFDAVEAGQTVRVFRNGKPVAQIVPINDAVPAWKRDISPLDLKGLSLSAEILRDRAKSR